MMSEGSILYKIFRKKEKRLYEISDRIGCMSPANCEYVIKHNRTIDPNKVEVCPNAIEPINIPVISEKERDDLLSQLDIPTDKTLFIYGGNLGKPQGIDFLLKVVEANEVKLDSHIVIVGDGTEFPKIKAFFDSVKPKNATLIAGLPKNDYDNLIRACHVGLIFLDPRFTIPNFPSRLLSYLENSMPVLLATDINTDIGKIAEREGFGLWSVNGNLNGFMTNLDKLSSDKDSIVKMGKLGNAFLLHNYTVDRISDIIMDSK